MIINTNGLELLCARKQNLPWCD